MSRDLAMAGGRPVWSKGWPPWPQADVGAVDGLIGIARGARWAVSGSWTGRPPIELELSRRFAEFVGADWCIPVDHGSSGLLSCMTALGIGPGDEVIVPGLAWVACASAVVRAGAVPVLVDIDSRTLCMDPDAVAAAIGPSTAAVLVVHLYSAMADMTALSDLAARHGLALIEDSAQAYGATWRGAAAGSLGVAGSFSTQQGKTLTSGEGGLVVTSDRELRNKIEMLRGDGRMYRTSELVIGRPDLEERADVQGWNMHLSEFQAALLLDGLDRLNEQNNRRAAMAAALDKALVSMDDLEPIEPYRDNDRRAYYHYAIRLKDSAFGGASARVVCEALSAELGYWIHEPYRPLNSHPLYDPRRLPLAAGLGNVSAWNPGQYDLPVAHRESVRTILLHHPMLLGDDQHLNAIVEAFDKVREHARELPRCGQQ